MEAFSMTKQSGLVNQVALPRSHRAAAGMFGLAIVVAAATLATASRADEWADCHAAPNNPQVVLRGCSEIIKQGVRPKADIAEAYRRRGTVHGGQGRFQESLADFDQS